MTIDAFLAALLRSPLVRAARHERVPTPETLRAWMHVVHRSADYKSPDEVVEAEAELRALEHALWRLRVYATLVENRMAALRSGITRFRHPNKQRALF